MGLKNERKGGDRKIMRLRENKSNIKERRDRVWSHYQQWWRCNLWLDLSNHNAERERLVGTVLGRFLSPSKLEITSDSVGKI